MHVDDFVFCGNDLFQKNVISELKKEFKVETHESETFKFLGLGFWQIKDGITIEQNLCFIYVLNRYIEIKVFEKK